MILLNNMKHFCIKTAVFTFAVLFMACKSKAVSDINYTQIRINQEKNIPLWAECSFPSEQASYYLGNYDSNKGLFSSGSGKTKTEAEITTRTKLIDYCYSFYGISETKETVLYGVRIVDRYSAEDGTVYILMFISEKDAKKSIGD